MNGTRNLTQQDIQTLSHFVNEELIETITSTEAQQSFSPIQPNFTTSKLKNPKLQKTIIQSTVKHCSKLIKCCSKTLNNGLPNVSTSNKTIT